MLSGLQNIIIATDVMSSNILFNYSAKYFSFSCMFCFGGIFKFEFK